MDREARMQSEPGKGSGGWIYVDGIPGYPVGSFTGGLAVTKGKGRIAVPPPFEHLFQEFDVPGMDFKGSVRCMSGHKTFNITASRWPWHKTKDYMHFYFFLGAIPIGLFVTMMNVFIGPATLEQIPEDYVPKYWEYYRSPITRFLARYLFPNPQEGYERTLYSAVCHHKVQEIHFLKNRIRELIKDKQDYPAYGYHSAIQATEVKEYRKRLDERRL